MYRNGPLRALWTKMSLFLLLTTMCIGNSGTAFGEDMTLYATSFGRGQWSQDDWTLVKSPRWDYIGDWIQRDDYIENVTPPDTPPDRLIPRPHAYVSMVLKDPISTAKGFEVSARMAFEYDQGPQIVLAHQLGADENGYPEYREHYEVVLWSQGINIWHHTYQDGKPAWALVAYARFPVERRTPYDVQVRIEKPRQSQGGLTTGKMIVTSVNGKNLFAYHEPSLPDELYVGIIGYASVNHFYNFQVKNIE